MHTSFSGMRACAAWLSAAACLAGASLCAEPQLVRAQDSREAGDGRPAPDVDPVQPNASAVTEASRRFAIPTSWVRAVMHTESRGNPRAISPAGAMGLMQIMPGTWAELTARFDLGSDPFDARASIHAGAAYLRMMLNRYGDLGTALAAYNAGPGRVDAYLAGRRPLPRETVAYVADTTRMISGEGVSLAALHPAATPIPWRSSKLFATQTEVPVSVENATTDAAFPLSNPLFIPLSGEHRP